MLVQGKASRRAGGRVVAALLLVALASGARAELRINELDYDQGANDTLEFLEIINVGTEAVDLTDWDLETGPVGHINLPPVVVAPGAYFVVCGPNGLPTPCNVRFPRANNLPDGPAGEVRLVAPGGEVVEEVVYELTPEDFADPGAAVGIALARCPDGVAALGLADFVPVPGTPGAPNACDALLAPAPPEAGTVGDQLLFFYDARPGRTTFLSVGNPNPAAALLEVVFYDQALATRLAEQVLEVPAHGARVLDPTLIAGVPGHAGLAAVTPIVTADDHRPLVLQRPLVGGYTVANVALGAGFGQNPFGRLAVAGGTGARDDVPRAGPGTVVDGQTVRFQTIQPGTTAPSLVVPAHFNPAALAPPEQDGNRLVLAAFRDAYDAAVGPGGASRFTLEPVARDLSVSLFDDEGTAVVSAGALAVSGVRLDTLQGLAGGAVLDRPGYVELTLADPPAAGEGFLGLFGQALGTFAVGQRLPSLSPPAGATRSEAGTAGDQLLFLYDARAGRTTFLAVANPNDGPVVVEIVFYAQDFLSRLAESVVTIPARGVRVIDPTGPAFGFVPGNAGLASVTPIASDGDHTPVVHPAPLVGAFTIVNLALGAGFGQNPFARLAVSGAARATPPAGGTLAVDGAAARYQPITPPRSPRSSGSTAPSLTVPVHFNPQTLSPAELDGNRLFLASFRDAYAAPVGPGGAPRLLLVPEARVVAFTLYDQAGTALLADGATMVSGVELATLQSLAGGLVLDRPGRVELRLVPFDGLSVLGLFSQAVGTFAVGQRLPPMDYD